MELEAPRATAAALELREESLDLELEPDLDFESEPPLEPEASFLEPPAAVAEALLMSPVTVPRPEEPALESTLAQEEAVEADLVEPLPLKSQAELSPLFFW